MKYVFIDTNIWLSLYHFTNDDLSEFEKLKDMVGDSINLIIPKQVYDEIKRNRESKIMDALKNFELKVPKFPVFCKGYDEYEPLRNDLYSLVNKFNSFKYKIESDITSEELPADKTLRSFFSNIDLISCDDYVSKAYIRYGIGNPPGKDNKYGDAINWECILDNVPNGEDLYFISADKDYRSLISNENMNPFLLKEWEEKKESKIYFYSTLVGFLDEHVDEIQLKAEIDKQKLIDNLYKSGSFASTHEVIALLRQYSGWTKQQIEKICSALVDNRQVSWIIHDPDIFKFYHSIIAEFDYEKLSDGSIRQAIDIINGFEDDAQSDYEAEKSEALEEYYKH